ncbi:MAG: tRNA lysidine(34) synthetase TilS [Candidatus Babeliales bacterium]
MIIKQIEQFINKYNLLPPKSKIILGLSGGPDSVFLFHFLAKKHHNSSISLIAAHLDHEWRSDSYKDEQFCQKIAKKLNIPYISSKKSELDITEKYNGSQEELARKMRRHFFEAVRKNFNADYIALAHHLQDQQETLFIRLIRGATLTGLTAMQPKYANYIRPLLEINKQDIINYLQAHNIDYIKDPSNDSLAFLRNRIRHKVLPALQECDIRFDINFLATLNRLQETENFLQQYTKTLFEQINYKENKRTSINLIQFFSFDITIQYRLLIYWLEKEKMPFLPTQNFLNEIIRFFKQPGSKEHHIHKQWKLVKKREIAHIRRYSTRI